jgi:PAS domain S-box-containing protein
MSIHAWLSILAAALVVAAVATLPRLFTRRRRERARVLSAQRLLDIMVDNSSDAIIHESLSGTILGWNAGAEKMFGVPASTALGRRMATVIPPERIAGEDVIVASLTAGVRLRDFETSITREDGRRVLVSVTVAPIRNDGGTTVGALRTIRDISDRKRLEDSVHKLAVDLSLVRQGRLDLRKQRIELAPVLERAIDLVDVTTSHRPRTLQVTQLGEPVFLHADPMRLEQVIGTLLINASRFTSTGGHIWLEVDRHGEFVVITVRDDGKGIAADQLPQVFDMGFNPAASIDTPHDVIHLGLPLVKAIVEMHGGSVSVQSAGRGAGSEFGIRLPIAGAPDQPVRSRHIH